TPAAKRPAAAPGERAPTEGGGARRHSDYSASG
ncbi:MAG: hypothetical protein RL669_220, partial [Pseudomonadota bacterium]